MSAMSVASGIGGAYFNAGIMCSIAWSFSVHGFSIFSIKFNLQASTKATPEGNFFFLGFFLLVGLSYVARYYVSNQVQPYMYLLLSAGLAALGWLIHRRILRVSNYKARWNVAIAMLTLLQVVALAWVNYL